MTTTPHQGPMKRVERVLMRVTTVVAMLGGMALIGIALTTVYSILGRVVARYLAEVPLLAWWRPVRGDFELVQLGTAFAIFAFLPYTHMVRGNVLVDFFTAKLHGRGKAALAVPSNLLLTAIVGLFTWRMIVATIEFKTATFTQTSMLLSIPVWWGYVPASLFMMLYTLVALFSVWRSTGEALGAGEPAR